MLLVSSSDHFDVSEPGEQDMADNCQTLAARLYSETVVADLEWMV